MKTYKASEMETCKEAWNGDTDWCSFRDGWMARASRPVEAALQERLTVADQRVDDLENADKPDADGWREWHGVDRHCPVGRVELQFRNTVGSWISLADQHDWSHDGSIADIVKWRPAK